MHMTRAGGYRSRGGCLGVGFRGNAPARRPAARDFSCAHDVGTGPKSERCRLHGQPLSLSLSLSLSLPPPPRRASSSSWSSVRCSRLAWIFLVDDEEAVLEGFGTSTRHPVSKEPAVFAPRCCRVAYVGFPSPSRTRGEGVKVLGDRHGIVICRGRLRERPL
ncbi:uncharacterized protein LY79DRAFT_363146 [Colletotrichum navitas]|uniref:Uncharacterized protein n=1 Tax=Colletotrichum navitas TaxID=681940 RepID=A0AAD8UZ99_9PEZI|nr:uncharacterized protein LY79DRAFT_363146 [Colletotrichum navitas]KAK1574706.1 hypothetical protein LY79DRAFT_363146 [Colletotrichum navitas]